MERSTCVRSPSAPPLMLAALAQRTLTVGGETTLPYLHFEGEMNNRPALALEIRDRKPDDWSPLLEQVWGEAMNDPGAWAKAAEQAGAELLYMTLSATLADGSPNTPEAARAAVRKVLDATRASAGCSGSGPGRDWTTNSWSQSLRKPRAENLLLGICEEGNYRTIVAAAAMANNHLVQSKTPMDVNLSKQLVILVNEMGMPLERIIMDPTTAALGYGIEYGYSVMERLRLAALQGDKMTQQPMLVNPGEEAWRVKEAKVGEGVPEAWGDWEKRALGVGSAVPPPPCFTLAPISWSCDIPRTSSA